MSLIAHVLYSLDKASYNQRTGMEIAPNRPKGADGVVSRGCRKTRSGRERSELLRAGLGGDPGHGCLRACEKDEELWFDRLTTNGNPVRSEPAKGNKVRFHTRS